MGSPALPTEALKSYIVTDPSTGKRYKFTGTHPPTQDEIVSHLGIFHASPAGAGASGSADAGSRLPNARTVANAVAPIIIPGMAPPDAQIGVLKHGTETVVGLGSLVSQLAGILNPARELNPNAKGPDFPSGSPSEVLKKIGIDTTASNNTQGAGKLAASIGEYFLPGAAAGEAPATLLAKVLAGGAEAAGVNSAQRGTVDQGSAAAGVLGALAPAVAGIPGAAIATKAAGRRALTEVLSSILDPNKATPSVGQLPVVAAKGAFGGPMQTLLDNLLGAINKGSGDAAMLARANNVAPLVGGSLEAAAPEAVAAPVQGWGVRPDLAKLARATPQKAAPQVTAAVRPELATLVPEDAALAAAQAGGPVVAAPPTAGSLETRLAQVMAALPRMDQISNIAAGVKQPGILERLAAMGGPSTAAAAKPVAQAAATDLAPIVSGLSKLQGPELTAALGKLDPGIRSQVLAAVQRHAVGNALNDLLGLGK